MANVINDSAKHPERAYHRRCHAWVHAVGARVGELMELQTREILGADRI